MKSYWLRFGQGNPTLFTGFNPTFTVFSANGLTAISAPSITETPAASGLYKFTYGPTLPMLFVADGGASLTSSTRYLSGVLDLSDAIDESVTAQGSTLVGTGVTLTAIGSTLSGMGATLSGVGSTLSGVGSTLSGMGSTLSGMGSTLLGMGSTLFGMGSTLGAMGVTLQLTSNNVISIGTSLSVISAGLGSTASSFGSSVVDPTDIYGLVKRLQEILEGNAVFDKASGTWSIYSRGSSVLIQTKVLTNSLTSASKN